MRKYVCVDDVGKVINPLIVEGQMHGGLAQGIAQALFEEANYDEQGTLVNGTFVDYTLPSAADLPSFATDRTETPATTNPLGVKGVGEAAPSRPPRPIVNGVLDAVRHLGVDDIEMPTTPQRVWRAIQEARAAPPRRRRSTPTRRVPGWARSTRTTLRERSSDPRPVRLRQARLGRRGRRGAAEAGEDAKILAGGQSLIPVLRLRMAAPSMLVDLGGIAELRGIRGRRRRASSSAR